MPPVDRKPSSNAKTWPTPKGTPIVFAVQPTKYEVVAPTELAEWEKTRTAALGLAPEHVKSLRGSGIGTWSFSPIGGGYDTFDDSDYIP